MELIVKLLADFLVIPIILIGSYSLIRFVPKGKRLESYSRILMAGLTAYLIAKLVGYIYQPSDMRPFEILGADPGASYLDNPGFPSDHMLFVSSIVCAVWFETKKKKLSIFLAIMALSVGLGRVVALVHTPLDVVGGLAMALIGSLWYINCSKVRSKVRSRGNGGSRSR